MTRPYSMDLRQRAVSLVEAGYSRRAAARLLDLGEATVIRWLRRHAEMGSCAAKPMGGSRHDVLRAERDWLLARITDKPDLTIRGLRAELAERGTKVSYDAVWRFMHRARLSFKKKPARRRAGSAGRRAQARPLEALPRQD